MYADYYESKNHIFPCFNHDGSKASQSDAIANFMGNNPTKWPAHFVVALHGLNRFCEGGNIEITDILSFMAGEKVWLESRIAA